MSKIDFVITWVDGNDPKWQDEKRLYSGQTGDTRESRYRSWDNLQYWFRAVEKFAPWVNKVHFLTYGHYPEWLNLKSKKLHFVKHTDFIPHEYLPTFSCRPIEFNLHRIPGLSEKFVYFNDDMFLLRTVTPSDFFRDNLPCDTALLDALCINGRGRSGEKISMDSLYTAMMFNMAIINRNFSKDEVIKKHLMKWLSPCYGLSSIRTLLLMPWKVFPGIRSPHLPYSYTKSTFFDVWKKEHDVLDVVCTHKFRTNTDVSSALFSFWQIANGQFAPRSPRFGKQTFISNDPKNNAMVYELIEEQKYKVLCINDEYSGGDFESVKKRLNRSFEKILPEKSSFEL